MAKNNTKRSRKNVWIVLLLCLPGLYWGYVRWKTKPPVTVQTGKVVRQDLTSIVTASGEIRPLNWVNIGATAYGQITDILVKEGERVKAGQVLAHLESVQPGADVDAQKASLASAEADVQAAIAAAKSAQATHLTARADLMKAEAEAEKARLEFGRIASIFQQRLASRSDYDSSNAAAQVAVAAVERCKAMVLQTQAQADQVSAQLASSRTRVQQIRAGLTRLSHVLTKHSFVSPLGGLVTNLPVHVGETVVMGIQNAPGSTIMTIADMSVIVAEVKVDETDIVNVRVGQKTEVTIDAIPDKKFTGRVTEIGNSAIVRSTGQATSLSSTATQEAKDFKVVVKLDAPPDNLRPGLSTTAKIQTTSKKGIQTVPIQAITIRKRGELVVAAKPDASAASTQPPDDPKARALDNIELQGLFVIRRARAFFVPVQTGIMGITDIEVDGGPALKDGEDVVTGTYKVLRSLKNQATVQINNDSADKIESDGEESR